MKLIKIIRKEKLYGTMRSIGLYECPYCKKFLEKSINSARNQKYCSHSCHTRAYAESLPVHFNKKPIKYYIDENGCHICTSHHINKTGYPMIRKNGTSMLLARHICQEKYGKLMRGIVSRHKCDNPSCINPDHLEIGTYKDNTLDAVKRGRWVNNSGENNPRSKLTLENVQYIRSCKDKSLKELSRIFNICVMQISKIRTGRAWKVKH